MSEGDNRPRGGTKNVDTGLGIAERVRMVVVGVLASASLAGLLFATAAQGGSGGVSPDGDGDGSRASKYDSIWDDFTDRQRRWARQTSECESGGDRNIHGGGGAYHGAFQFMTSTWQSSPRSVGSDPHEYSWKIQAVVAVLLKKRDGAGHWPNCG
ncbi:MAG: transglycosylase family protein [Solirubrobacterales bacterium]